MAVFPFRLFCTNDAPRTIEAAPQLFSTQSTTGILATAGGLVWHLLSVRVLFERHCLNVRSLVVSYQCFIRQRERISGITTLSHRLVMVSLVSAYTS